MYDIYLQNPSFTTINLQKRKSPSAKDKGLERSGSPDRTIIELFV
jgi:hypothetical protein